MRVWGNKPKKPKKHYGRKLAVSLLLLTLAAGTLNYFRPLPAIQVQYANLPTFSAEPLTLTWPNFGQAAVATADSDILATAGTQKPLAMASIAKVITALALLDKYPLKPGQTGPTFTITSADVDIYNSYVQKDGSVTAVSEGEKITEYQVLEALLLPSSNNLADSAAIWAYGDLPTYWEFANRFLATHGLTQTQVGVDASGYDPASTSTAADLAHLGLLALKEPVLVEIMSKTHADLPVVGKVSNYNAVLGKNGIFGIKTGNNDQNHGAFLFAATVPVADSSVTVTGAVMGASSLAEALTTSLPLISSIQTNFKEQTVLPARTAIATYRTAWGATATARTVQDLTLLHWKGDGITIKPKLQSIETTYISQKMGSVQARSGHTSKSTSITLDASLSGPSFWWRLTRH